ncbi:MAG: hypothetical protein GQ474_08840 [Sulfurimonas sp.]|nr:hypothetical protein [Sulfurimonas sp.]
MYSLVGTIFRAFSVFMVIISIWFGLISLIYFTGTVIMGIEFSLQVALLIFLITIIFRMFYPRNVFK